MSKVNQGGVAIIEDGAIVIRFPLDAMQSALDGAWTLNVFDTRYKVTDQNEFAKELCSALNQEDEQGTTEVHKLMDRAFVNIIDYGGFGFDEHEDQNLPASGG